MTVEDGVILIMTGGQRENLVKQEAEEKDSSARKEVSKGRLKIRLLNFREMHRPEHISPPICWVKIQTGGMGPI